MDHDPETGAFPDRPELEDEVDENVLASMTPSKRPAGYFLSDMLNRDLCRLAGRCENCRGSRLWSELLDKNCSS
jgi:hypothetical protein